MLLDHEQFFIERCLKDPPSETVEDVGAVTHETNRIPDPRILIIRDGRILRLDGIEVDHSIEKDSYVGRLEYSAFREIKTWANMTEEGIEAWFSSPFPENLPPEKRKYKVSKIDLGEIRYSLNGEKVLLKRAILLDIDSDTLLGIANRFARKINAREIDTDEGLRTSPIFFKEDEFYLLLKEIAAYTSQVQQVENGEDLITKIETYAKLKTIYEEVPSSNFHFPSMEYAFVRRRAEEEKMIGEKSESCPGGTQSAFQAFSGISKVEGVKTLPCTCPTCGQRVNAIIFASTIHCPNCGASAHYVC